VLVTFDKPLVAGVLNAGNWFVRVGGNSYGITSAISLIPAVLLTLGAPVLNPGPNVVSYSPPPFDVLSSGSLVPAEAFSDFPVT
jgi:hypothetical protein